MQEEFVDPLIGSQHFEKHKKQFPDLSEEEYIKKAEELQDRTVDYRNIFGYVTKTDDNRLRYIKYNKQTEEIVVYVFVMGKKKTISYYLIPWKSFQGKQAAEYYDEIPKRS